MKRIIPIIAILAAIGGGYWWFNQRAATAVETTTGSTALVGSGTIEAEIIAITAELGGRVTELMVDEGDEVEAGQVLVELDKADLLAQQIQLEAALATAQTNLRLISARARREDIAVAQAQLARAEVAADGAKRTWERVAEMVNNPHELEAQISQAQTQVTEAERSLELAQVNLKKMEIQAEAASRNQSNHEALVQNEAAQYRLQAAQAGVELAEVALAGTKRQVEHLIGIRAQPLQLIARANTAEAVYRQAAAAVLVAEANLVAVEADPTGEDIAVAAAQVGEAEAALSAVEVQLAKQTLTAPRAGLITHKLISPGELAEPGAVLLELSDIDTVDLTVYIPETRIGEVKIGQQAQVYVDAYDDEQFEGMVSFIAHEAEFTPRNVQTQEERVNLVFAVKISLDNADHRLKPGMPADAFILAGTQSRPINVPSPSGTRNDMSVPTIVPTPVSTPTATKTPASPEARPTVSPLPVENTPAPQAEVLTWWLNVRSGPGVDYPIIDTLARGEVVPVIDIDPDSGWLQITLRSGKQVGWISGNPAYVSIQ